MHMILMKTFSCQWKVPGNSLVAQWLGFHASTARDTGSNPWQGTKYHKSQDTAKTKQNFKMETKDN